MKAPARFVATFARSGASRSQGRAVVIRGAFSRTKGISAPPSRQARGLLAVLALAIATFVLAAAPAGAAVTITTPVVSDVSYTSAHVTSEVNPGNGGISYSYEVSTDGTNWTPNAGGFCFSSCKGSRPADLSGLQAATKYFVRLKVNNFVDPEATSPGPNPSFTTLTAEPPTIPGTVAASGLLSTSATGIAKVKRPVNSDDAKCHFEYVSDGDFTATGFAGATVRDCAQNPIEAADAGTEKDVTAPLGCTNPVLEGPEGKCLKAETTYHLRLVAETGGGAVTKDAASTFTTAAAVAKPTVIAINDATDVGKRTAKATGEIQRPAGADPALDTSCRFEYVSDADFTATGFDAAGQTPCVEAPAEAPLSDTDPTPVSAEIGGLEPGTTYHLRLTAENGAGADTEVAAGTFTTLSIVPANITIDSITEVGYQKALVTATADPGNQGLYSDIEYALVGTEEWFGPQRLAQGIGGVPPSVPPRQFFTPLGPGGCNHESPAQSTSDCTLTSLEGGRIGQLGPGLKPGTTYKVRGGWRDGEELDIYRHSLEPYPEFTTKGTSTPPSASCDPITVFSGTTAHFTCTVDPKAPAGPLDDEGKATYKTAWHFECTPECKGANGDVIGGTVEAEGGAQSIAGDANRLEPNTHYEVKLVIENSLGAFDSSVLTFNTPLIKPTVKSLPGASDGKGGYILEGLVNPNNSNVTDCKFEYGPNNTYPNTYSIPCSPAPGDKAQPITVEGHVTGLTPDATYHAKLIATNAGGTADGGDQIFIPTLDPEESCPNQELRKENNSLALPECRAYEMVTPPGKEGFPARFVSFGSGDSVFYRSGAGNLARSGQNSLDNSYVATRTESGWQTIPDLNGPDGSLYQGPDSLPQPNQPWRYSSDLRSSLWRTWLTTDPPPTPPREFNNYFYLRNPNGTFTKIGSANHALGCDIGLNVSAQSSDLSHVVAEIVGVCQGATEWGPGVYEYVGTGVDKPRRVDVDNFGNPIPACNRSTQVRSISGDGRVIFFTAYFLSANGGCAGADTDEIWARIDGTTSVDVSASQCNRVVPAEPCNAPAKPTFEGSTPDGSRVFFTTTQQLVNADVDQTKDIYACDIPSGTPAPGAGKANHCTALMLVSGVQTGADVESFLTSSDNGTTVLFTAKGVLADNEDALGEEAVAGGHNLYVWRTDVAHPAGQTTFVGRLDSADLVYDDQQTVVQMPQFTPDGRYLVFTTANRLVEADNDDARDVYRYDAEADELIRASTNVFGTAGNGSGFDARAANDNTVSDDGQKIVFNTTEALSPADGNAESDAYLWTPARVSLITAGSVGAGVIERGGGVAPRPIAIDGSGQNIYFQTAGAFSPADGDSIGDVYVARIGGGFSFAEAPPCSGEACQPDPTPASAKRAPGSAQPGLGNPPPSRPCLKGKVKRHGKCVKKPKKHSGKKRSGGKASHKQGGGK